MDLHIGEAFATLVEGYGAPEYQVCDEAAVAIHNTRGTIRMIFKS